ncbi:hypothetical protein P8R55_08895 [Lactobacillus johnsonii]|uniref:hypothetical protein n=1 Tax=Lactobacillus johnsonii TaxID=33959 RepID=UPI00389015A9
MTKKKKKINYALTPIWHEIEKIIKNPDFKGSSMKTNDDFVLYRKIINFLYRGAAGTLFEIKEGLVEEGLEMFMQYLHFFLADIDKPGHYYPSALVKKQVKDIKRSSKLFELKDTLNEISRLEYSKHGDNEAKGWKPNESER